MDTMSAAATQQGSLDREKVLPLPGWLVKVYFIFPVILYIPDAIFNYYVYSDGWNTADSSPLVQVGKVALVSFLSIGVVGMAYLLSVLAPWHWGQGHRVQAFFCGLGVVIATAITTWNSLAYRSESFVHFKTDQWAFNVWPDLKANNISITMILVSIAPPFWGLFWAIVQPTETGRSLRQLQESHAERLLRVQHEAEVKRLKAEANAKVREAQLRGMARTAATAREQAAEVLRRKKADEGETGEQPAIAQDAQQAASQADDANDSGEHLAPHKIVNLPTVASRDPGHGRTASFMNSVAPAGPSMHMEPAGGSPFPSQSALFADSDASGMPTSDTSGATWTRRPPTLANNLLDADATDTDAMTGTTGPRQAVRRSPYESGTLMRSMNEVPAAYTRAYDEAMSELNPTGAKKNVSATALNKRVAEKLNIDEAQAKAVVSRVRESRRTSRS
ncbi:MAG TPA: hypothetical protein VFW17_16930 [Ktedonobacterales bacterium]|nr:hypothetical protein [Ktedonobacterales bacterium]